MAAISATCSKTWEGGGFSATNVDFRCQMILSTTAYSARKATTFMRPPHLGQSMGSADKHRQHLPGEDLGQPRVVNPRDLVKDTRLGRPAFGYQVI